MLPESSPSESPSPSAASSETVPPDAVPVPGASAAGDRVSDRVAQTVLDMIARGDLAPGERLPGERQLAETMQVSRVSVRAALQQLKAQGFLSAVQGGGTRVVSSVKVMDAPLTEMVRTKIDNLYDLAEIRVVLEAWAANRAAQHASDAQIAELRALVARMSDPRRRHLRADDDMDFHVALAKTAGSAVYLHILSVVRETLSQMMRFHRQELFGPGADSDLLDQHGAILAAIEARDGAAAAAAMTEHLSWVLRHYQELRPAVPAPNAG